MRDPSELSLSMHLREIVGEAEDIAFEAGHQPSSAHLLLALFTVKNRAERFLIEQGIDEDRLLEDPALVARAEPAGAVRAIMTSAAQTAASSGSRKIDALHALVGITRTRDSAAHRLLERAGARPAHLRTLALTRLTAGAPRWVGSDRPRKVADDLSNRRRATHWTPPMVEQAKPSIRSRPPARRAPELPALPSGDAISVPAALPEPSPPVASPPVASALVAPSERKPAPIIESAPISDPGAAWLLPPTDFPWLDSLGRNLSAEAARGELDPLFLRDAELDQLVDVLGKRRANNPCLIGEPGVGKTALVEGLASRWVRGDDRDRERIIIGLDAGRLLVGTHLRGSFSEKLAELKEEVRRAEGKVLVFFDEIHTLVGAGAGGDGAVDAAQELKAALARGEFPCIGATTPEEYHRSIAKDPALARRFVPIMVEEPSAERATTMLGKVLPAYARHHGVGYQPGAIDAAVRLSVRFLPEERLPDKALGLLDLAGSRAVRAGRSEVDAEAIAVLLSERLGLPLERLSARNPSGLDDLQAKLSQHVIGHDAVLRRIAEVVKRHAAGFTSDRPQGSFLFVGPSGVGKTETAKALAEVLHGSRDCLLRFDLSEFAEAHSSARLVGAPPGYVGHEAGGQLTEAVRKQPGRVLLFDEIEKAHRDVLQLLLQILDDGRLTDGHGRTVSFSETLVVMTSNLGADRFVERKRRIGFDADPDQAELEAEALSTAKSALSPELWGRIDEKLVFAPLGRAEVRRIARLLVAASSARLERERGISFELEAEAVDAVIEQGGFDASLGARPLRRTLGRLVESPIAARILEGKLRAGERVIVGRQDNGGLVFRV